MGDDGKMMRRLADLARQTLKRVVICEGNMDNMLRSAARLAHDGICSPVVLGNEEMIEKRADRLGLSLDGVEIVNPATTERRQLVNAMPQFCRKRRLTRDSLSIMLLKRCITAHISG